jgi:multidrug efflux pump subunit AcrB
MQFRTDGIPVTSIRQDIRNVEVWARARDASDTPPVYELLNNHGKKVPLSQVGPLEVRYEEALVRRINGEKFIDIMSDVTDAQPQDVTTAIWNTLAPLRASLPPVHYLKLTLENDLK